ncbi:MAG: hypothetical protein NPIRA05_10770 [Nitrospirales bacterium]|nr:MAG: hypothetical protein NPIRA05_10770 [Nitrospirales bacterium]
MLKNLNSAHMYLWFTLPVLSLFSGILAVDSALGSTGTEVFRGFTSHISQHILQNKQDFYVAQSCTSFFYKKAKKPQRPQVERISSLPASQPPENFDCSTRYPKGLDEAREAFSHTQQTLSLSLTFFEFALVGDRDDDEDYAGMELQDVMESFGVTFEPHLPSSRYVSSLNGLFDTVMDKGEIETLTKSLGILLEKGYRFTSADQAALNREIN